MWQPLFTYLLLGSGERNSSTAAGIQVIAVRTAIQCNFRLNPGKDAVNPLTDGDPVTTCTTRFCAASGEKADRKLRPTVTLASPPSPRVAGRRPMSGPICNHRAIFAGSTSFAAVSPDPEPLRESFADTDDRKIPPNGTPRLQASDVMKVASRAFEVRVLPQIAAVCCRIQNQRGLDLHGRCSMGSSSSSPGAAVGPP
jgi:hypothetical protein